VKHKTSLSLVLCDMATSSPAGSYKQVSWRRHRYS